MKILKGRPNKIEKTFIGRVEVIRSDARGHSHLLTSAESSEHVLLRSGSPIKGCFVHSSILFDTPLSFSVGDVVRIEPDGFFLREYEQAQADNPILLTEACNSQCLMCPQPPKLQKETYCNEAIEIVKNIAPSPEALGVTGGEPTCTFSELIKLLCAIRHYHPACHIQLLTNARKLSDIRLARTLSESAGHAITVCIPVYSELASVHDEVVGSAGAWEETMAGIANLARFGVAIEIRTLLLQQNISRLPQWAEFIYRNAPFTVHIAIMALEPMGYAKKNWDILVVKPEAAKQYLLNAVRRLHRREMTVSLYNMQRCLLPPELWQFSVSSISGWKVQYAESCSRCRVKQSCGGFFFSAFGVEGWSAPEPIL